MGRLGTARGMVVAPAAPTQYPSYNNNLKIDPCNRWKADMHDKTDTVG
jgi:hypothetical protein